MGFFDGFGDMVSGVTNSVTSGVTKLANVGGNLAEDLLPAYEGFKNLEFADDERSAQLELMRSQALANRLTASGASSQQTQPEKETTPSWVIPSVAGVFGLIAVVGVIAIVKK